MEELKQVMIMLFDNKIPFEFDGYNWLIVGEGRETGVYGHIKTIIEYDKYEEKKFTVNYGHKGYPQLEQFDDVDAVYKFVAKLEG